MDGKHTDLDCLASLSALSSAPNSGGFRHCSGNLSLRPAFALSYLSRSNSLRVTRGRKELFLAPDWAGTVIRDILGVWSGNLDKGMDVNWYIMFQYLDVGCSGHSLLCTSVLHVDAHVLHSAGRFRQILQFAFVQLVYFFYILISLSFPPKINSFLFLIPMSFLTYLINFPTKRNQIK